MATINLNGSPPIGDTPCLMRFDEVRVVRVVVVGGGGGKGVVVGMRSGGRDGGEGVVVGEEGWRRGWTA